MQVISQSIGKEAQDYIRPLQFLFQPTLQHGRSGLACKRVHALQSPIKTCCKVLSTKVITSTKHKYTYEEISVAPFISQEPKLPVHNTQNFEDCDRMSDVTVLSTDVSTCVTSASIDRENHSLRTWMYWGRWKTKKEETFIRKLFPRSKGSASSESDLDPALDYVDYTTNRVTTSAATLFTRKELAPVKCYTKVFAVLTREFLLLYRSSTAPRSSRVGRQPLVQIAVTTITRVNQRSGAVFVVRDPNHEEMELHLYDRDDLTLADEWEDALHNAASITNQHLSNFLIDVEVLPRSSLYRGTLLDLRQQRMSFCENLQEKIKSISKRKSLSAFPIRRSLTVGSNSAIQL